MDKFHALFYGDVSVDRMSVLAMSLAQFLNPARWRILAEGDMAASLQRQGIPVDLGCRLDGHLPVMTTQVLPASWGIHAGLCTPCTNPDRAALRQARIAPIDLVCILPRLVTEDELEMSPMVATSSFDRGAFQLLLSALVGQRIVVTDPDQLEPVIQGLNESHMDPVRFGERTRQRLLRDAWRLLRKESGAICSQFEQSEFVQGTA